MLTNKTPAFDPSDNETNCCPRFHPERWDGQTLRLDTMYFFYTTCPKCATHYGKNYVVGVAKVS